MGAVISRKKRLRRVATVCASSVFDRPRSPVEKRRYVNEILSHSKREGPALVVSDLNPFFDLFPYYPYPCPYPLRLPLLTLDPYPQVKEGARVFLELLMISAKRFSGAALRKMPSISSAGHIETINFSFSFMERKNGSFEFEKQRDKQR